MTRGHAFTAADRDAVAANQYAFPRERKEPLTDATHVRNAMARFNQVEEVSDAERTEAFRRIREAAERFGVEMAEERWQDLGRPSSSPPSPSKDELYVQAARRNIRGRSKMTKEQLRRALAQ
jgi:hypothetical protein